MNKILLARTLVLTLALVATGSSAQGISGRDHGVWIANRTSYTALPVCYDFHCKTRQYVTLSGEEWQQVADWFDPPAKTPDEERKQIRHAIGWMEVVVGNHAPTSIDLEFDEVHNINDRETGQLDCVDESVNTTTYLRLFESSGFLKHHVVIGEAYRKALFDQHWAGQVREKETGTRYIVDTWFQPNGHLPTIQKSLEWEDIGMLTAVVDNSVEYKKEDKPPFWKRILRIE